MDATWTDVDRATKRRVSVGDGEPATTLRHVHASEAEARRAAEAEFRRRARGQTTFWAELARFAPDIIAGARMTLTGVSGKCDGQ